MFDQEDWADNDDGKTLESNLFHRRPKESITKRERKEITTCRKRNRKVKRGKDLAKSMETTTQTYVANLTKPADNKGKGVIRSKTHVQNGDRNQKRFDKKLGNEACHAEFAQTSKKKRKNNKRGRLLDRDIPNEKLEDEPLEKRPKNGDKNEAGKTRSDPDSESALSRSQILRKSVTSKLQSAQFRFINEQLYTCRSDEAERLFRGNPRAFEAYHTGFTNQVSKWPVNPLNVIISFINKRPSKWVIGDFGCGDARLAASVKNKVHSFDLFASNSRVTVADISNVPLPDCTLDVAVFCLSLMGTNFVEFIKEANRTLKPKGLLKIAEVASRFTSVTKFVNLMKKLGFELDDHDQRNSHFYMFDFRKVKSCLEDVAVSDGLLKPCVYKKR